MVNCNMIQNDGDEVVDGPVVSEGGRSPSTLSPGQSAPATRGGAALGPLAPNQRWSAARKREVVLRGVRHGSMRQQAAVEITATGDRTHGSDPQRQARGGAGVRPD